jgi:hypothetical protein
MMMQMVKAFAEFERAMLRERTKAGLDAARRQGRIGGRRPKLSPQQQAARSEGRFQRAIRLPPTPHGCSTSIPPARDDGAEEEKARLLGLRDRAMRAILADTSSRAGAPKKTWRISLSYLCQWSATHVRFQQANTLGTDKTAATDNQSFHCSAGYHHDALDRSLGLWVNRSAAREPRP